MQHRWNKIVYTEWVIDKWQPHPCLNNTLCPGILSGCHELHSKISHNLQANNFLEHNHLEQKSWFCWVLRVFFPVLNAIFSLNYFLSPIYSRDDNVVSCLVGDSVLPIVHVSQTGGFLEMSTTEECQNHHGTVLSDDLQSSQTEISSQFQEWVNEVRPHNPPFDSYSFTAFYPTYVFIQKLYERPFYFCM